MAFYPLAMLVFLLAFARSLDGLPKAHQAEAPVLAVNAIVHAVNAAESAKRAKEAASVAKNAAEHSQFVARKASSALRYTQDALAQAGVRGGDMDAVGRAADELESEAGIASGSGISRGQHNATGTAEYRRLEYELDRLEHEYDEGEAKSSVHDGFEAGKEELERLAKEGKDGDANGTLPFEIDSEVAPYPNSAEPFGREGTARDLTEASVRESDGMIDQIEKAQAIEGKRAVYRSLTKLRGATIASYDGIAKAHLKNVEDYAAAHKWRQEHVIHHLAEEEADVDVWAFPNRGNSGEEKRQRLVFTLPAAPAPVFPTAPSEGAPAPAAAK